MAPTDSPLDPRLHAEVLATVSHDIRAPLGVILGAINELVNPQVGSLNDEQRALVQLVRRSSEKLVRLAANVSFLHRLTAGRVALTLQSVDGRSFLRRAVESFERSSELGRIRVTVEAPEEALDVDAEVESLTQALTNLVANAVRFARNEVRVAIVREDGAALFLVEDDGPGVPEGRRALLFDPRARIPSHEGTPPAVRGLGLLVANEVVRGHGGSLRFEPIPDAERSSGARFVLQLPRHS